MDIDSLIELRHLRYFLAVAEELHFGQAAKRLHIAQPPLSQQIRRLEEAIGHPLFVRSSRSVKLTPAGHALLDRARRTLDKMGEDLQAVRSVARGEEGKLTIGFVGSAVLTPLPAILRRYREMYPKVQLRLRESHTAQAVQGIREGSVDVGLLRDPGPLEEIHTEHVLAEPFIAVVPRAHPLARRASIPVRLLRDEPFVFFPQPAGAFAWENAVRIFEEAGFRPRIVQEAPQWLTVLRLVGAGLGVTIAPSCVKKIATPDVVCRKLLAGRAVTHIDLAYRRDNDDPIAAAFCGFARGMFLRKGNG